MAEYIQVMTSAGSRQEADRIGSRLVDARLAACVQIAGPISSRYVWQGRVEEAEEWLCLAKTEATRYAEVEEAIRAAHSYDVPEILALPVLAGSPAYLDWLSTALAG